MESKSNNTLDANRRDISRLYIEGRQGIENILILIILRTALRIRELNI